MPTAVITESSEKMMSIIMIWMSTAAKLVALTETWTRLAVLELVMDFLGGFPDQEESADEQDEILDGDAEHAVVFRGCGADIPERRQEGMEKTRL